ncbi:hypothetical protein E4U10_005741 [Claviceps purpurea]|nr:hypothetical protein E4U27_000336 [Claviceps purpurea]KAG6201634.1 hypothetical protein E4U10_005741 [Claviceps purpurea]
MGSADVPTVAPIIAFLAAGVETDSDFAGQFARRVSTVGVDIVTIRRAEETAGSIGGQASVSFMKFAGDIANTQRGGDNYRATTATARLPVRQDPVGSRTPAI